MCERERARARMQRGRAALEKLEEMGVEITEQRRRSLVALERITKGLASLLASRDGGESGEERLVQHVRRRAVRRRSCSPKRRRKKVRRRRSNKRILFGRLDPQSRRRFKDKLRNQTSSPLAFRVINSQLLARHMIYVGLISKITLMSASGLPFKFISPFVRC